MAKAGIPSGGGKWAIPSASTGAPTTSKAKSGTSSSVAGANKHATTSPYDLSLASGLASKNKHHGG